MTESLIDLHSHILHGVDDGARTLEESLEMGRMAASEGIEVMACTPHFMPGLYDNTAPDIRHRIAFLNERFLQEGIDVALVVGCDAHMRPDFVECLQNGTILTLHDTRYVLFEPPHVVMPKRLDELLFNIQASGFVPILTHPERLKWIELGYDAVVDFARSGVLVQLTAGSITGRFGKRAAYWSQRMLADGIVSVIATDCHNLESRPPRLVNALDLAQSELGQEEGLNLVLRRPALILENAGPDELPPLPAAKTREPGWGVALRRMLKW
jgi:protein-tyrosine phosphatase